MADGVGIGIGGLLTGTLVADGVGIGIGLPLVTTPGAGVGDGVGVGVAVGVGDAVGCVVGPGGVRNPGGVVTLPDVPQAATQAATRMPMPRRTETPEGIKRTGGPLSGRRRGTPSVGRRVDGWCSIPPDEVAFLFGATVQSVAFGKDRKRRRPAPYGPGLLSSLVAENVRQQQLSLVAEK
ncbi:MAG: hypothetical protein ABR975_00960 [Vulcanimicrobiaceae bacterium]